MAGISGIGNQFHNNQWRVQNDQQKHMRHASSGKKIDKASDGAAEMAIAKKLANASKGFEVGRENLQAGRSALYIQDGGLAGVTDYMQRMRELTIRANSGLMSDEDKQYIQDEIDQIKQGSTQQAEQTQYNEKDLLTEDGSVTLLTDGSGATKDINTINATSEALGTANYTVLNNFDLETVDKAMEKISTARSISGAQTNAIDHTMVSNAVSAENLTASQSVIEDADMAEEMLAVNKNKTLTAAQIMMQKREEEEAQNRAAGILG